MKRKLMALAGVVLMLAAAGCSGLSGKGDKIVIGGKNYTEQDILVNIMKYVIEDKTGLKVVTKPYLGGTNIVVQALDRGDIDLYPEYTGTALINLLREPMISDPEAAYARVKQVYSETKGHVWLKPFGYNNTYTLSMRADKAAAMGIETFSDLAKKSPELFLGCTQEFLERPDGLAGLKKTYGIDFKGTSGMDPGLTYAAVRDKKVDVIDAFSTDGRIAAFNLKALKDDKHFFPPYYAAPVIRKEVLDKHPEVGEALNLLAGRLDDKQMAAMNAKVDLEKRDAKDVAREWLRSQGIIK